MRGGTREVREGDPRQVVVEMQPVLACGEVLSDSSSTTASGRTGHNIRTGRAPRPFRCWREPAIIWGVLLLLCVLAYSAFLFVMTCTTAVGDLTGQLGGMVPGGVEKDAGEYLQTYFGITATWKVLGGIILGAAFVGCLVVLVHVTCCASSAATRVREGDRVAVARGGAVRWMLHHGNFWVGWHHPFYLHLVFALNVCQVGLQVVGLDTQSRRGFDRGVLVAFGLALMIDSLAILLVARITKEFQVNRASLGRWMRYLILTDATCFVFYSFAPAISSLIQVQYLFGLKTDDQGVGQRICQLATSGFDFATRQLKITPCAALKANIVPEELMGVLVLGGESAWVVCLTAINQILPLLQIPHQVKFVFEFTVFWKDLGDDEDRALVTRPTNVINPLFKQPSTKLHKPAAANQERGVTVDTPAASKEPAVAATKAPVKFLSKRLQRMLSTRWPEDRPVYFKPVPCWLAMMLSLPIFVSALFATVRLVAWEPCPVANVSQSCFRRNFPVFSFAAEGSPPVTCSCRTVLFMETECDRPADNTTRDLLTRSGLLRDAGVIVFQGCHEQGRWYDKPETKPNYGRETIRTIVEEIGKARPIGLFASRRGPLSIVMNLVDLNEAKTPGGQLVEYNWGDNLIHLELFFSLRSSKMPTALANAVNDATRLRAFIMSLTYLSEISSDFFSNNPELLWVKLHSTGLKTLPKGVFRNNPRLTYLAIAHNSWPGFTTLPSDLFASLKSVKEIDLFSNKITALPPMAESTELVEFNINHNPIVHLPPGNGGSLCGASSKLRILYLQDTHIDVLPALTFSKCTALETLGLSHNHKLTSIPADVFYHNTLLKLLILNDHQLTTLPQNIFRQNSDLGEVRLHTGKLQELPPRVLSENTALRQLYLFNNDLRPLPEDIFAKTTALEMLALGGNPLGTLPGSGSKLVGLSTLTAPDTNLTALPSWISSLRSLEYANLEANDIKSALGVGTAITAGVDGLGTHWTTTQRNRLLLLGHNPVCSALNATGIHGVDALSGGWHIKCQPECAVGCSATVWPRAGTAAASSSGVHAAACVEDEVHPMCRTCELGEAACEPSEESV